MFQGDQPPPTGHLVDGRRQTRYDELLGKTYAEIGSEARAMHKCQGFGQLLALPGPWVVSYRLVDTVMPGQQDKDEATLFDGIGTSPSSLLRFAGDKALAPLVNGLNSIEAAGRNGETAAAQRRSRCAQSRRWPPGSRPRASCARASTRFGLPEDGVFEIDFRVARTIHEFTSALVLAQGLRLEALADDGVVTAGPAAEGDADRGQPREGQPRSRSGHARRR